MKPFYILHEVIKTKKYIQSESKNILNKCKTFRKYIDYFIIRRKRNRLLEQVYTTEIPLKKSDKSQFSTVPYHVNFYSIFEVTDRVSLRFKNQSINR